MIRNLLSLIATISFCILCFSQTISFETSEGYILGDINNQQGWSYLGNLTPNTGMVINTASTTGSNALKVVGNNTTDDGSVRKNVTGFNMTDYSFDYKIEDVDGSDYFMAVRDNSSSIIGAFVIDFQQGNLGIYNGMTEDTDDTAINISPDTWYHFKMSINKTTNTVQYFVNNMLLGSKSISNTTTNVSIIDFGYADFGTGFTVDNIKIADSNLLATSDTHSDAYIQIYPNPTSDYIYIKTQDKIESVEIYDISGNLVLKDLSGKNHVLVTYLQSGNYFLTVKKQDQIINKKFIKK